MSLMVAEQKSTNIHVIERRLWPRVEVRWRILLLRQTGRPISGSIENISSGGMLLLLPVTLAEGERMSARITVPADRLGYHVAPISLDCSIEVLRSHPCQSGFAAGCRLDEYCLKWPVPEPHSRLHTYRSSSCRSGGGNTL